MYQMILPIAKNLMSVPTKSHFYCTLKLLLLQQEEGN
jgi:hypothetical protein